jgi:hypothetical protein
MRVLFLFVGEPHHVFHALPVAAELATLRPDFTIEVALASKAHLQMVEQVQSVYPAFKPRLRILRPPAFMRSLQALGLFGPTPRVPTLLAALPWLRSFDALVVPERTTTILRHLLGSRTRLIFTPHGAGDRAIMLDPRDRHFDFVLVAGEKSERRLLEAGTIRPGAYSVNGYVKLDLLQRRVKRRPALFGNGRPTVLYAPHFRPSLSSWDRFGMQVIELFRQQDLYNLVVAPHIRLFHGISSREAARLLALAVPDKIIIDLGSERLVDMTYTSGADIYLGDVSSQVYEFILTPRPCIFLNAHDVHWEGNADYRFWTLGDVVKEPAGILPAVRSATARHPLYSEQQRLSLAESVGGDPAGAALRGAAAIAQFLDSRRE